MSEPRPTYTVTTVPPDELRESWWLAFTPRTEPLHAATRFLARTGREPRYCVKTPTLLLVGPWPGANPAVPHEMPEIEIQDQLFS